MSETKLFQKCRTRFGVTPVPAMIVMAAVLVLAITAWTQSAQAAPLAGTTIGNQASATYTDASAVGRTATSNTVLTTVQQVASFTMTATQTKTASPGSPVNFPHTIINTGNGADSFDLSVVNNAGTAGLAAALFYLDADCNGVADNATSILIVSGLAAAGLPGSQACFVAVTQVSGTAGSGDTGNFVITAASSFNPATTAANTDTVNVTAQAVINVTKGISIGSGNPGDTVTYTLTYTNTGNNAATSVILADFLPAGMTYVAGTAKLNGVAVTDAVDGDAFDYNNTVAGRLTAVIPSVGPSVTGTMSFQATANAGIAPGTLINEARFCYNDGAAQIPGTCTTANAASSATAGTGTATNPAPFVVKQTAAVVADDNVSTTDSDGLNDIITVASAKQGATVSFDSVIHNNGNGIDSFNTTLVSNTFPAGTTFLLYKADGVTPLTDTNGDGIADTGPVAAAAAYHVFVKATLPSGISGGGAYTFVLSAKSVFDPTKSDTVTGRLTTIEASTVDLTNDTPLPGAPGNGPGNDTAVTTNNVNPGASTTFILVVNNTSTIADSYALAVGTHAILPAATTPLPTGWNVTFYADNSAGACTTLGAVMTSTGVINSASSKVVCAVVTIPATGAGAAAGTTNLRFTVTSPITNASDPKVDAVNVNTIRSLTLTPNNSGQIYPSGSVVYSHTLTNTGNVLEGDGAASTLTLSDPMSGVTSGWSNIVYIDTNNDGSLDAGDAVVTGTLHSVLPAGLAPGAATRLFVKVLSPASAAPGAINTSTLTASVAGVINTVAAPAPILSTDTTTVISGQVELVKTQALDAACDDAADTAFSNAPITTGAIPNACILYKVTATNRGTIDVTNVVVSDATPANTSMSKVVACTGCAGAVTGPAVSATGTISAAVGTLTPGAIAVIDFGVRINP